MNSPHDIKKACKDMLIAREIKPAFNSIFIIKALFILAESASANFVRRKELEKRVRVLEKKTKDMHLGLT